MRIGHNILTLDVQVLSRSQVTPGLSMSMRMRPDIRQSTYIHTLRYIGEVRLW
jgi:hypothetical protein